MLFKEVMSHTAHRIRHGRGKSRVTKHDISEKRYPLQPESLDRAPVLTSFKEHAQLAAVREQADKAGDGTTNTAAKSDIEGGFGGLEDYEDRYATTSGEH